jgi:general secretion pathway protein G
VHGFQARFLCAQLSWTLGLLLTFAALIFGPTVLLLLTGQGEERQRAAATFLELHGAVWPALFGFAAGLLAVTTVLSHRVAGPLYRFRTVFDAVSRGHLWVSARIRRHDYPVLEAEALEGMVASLRVRVRTMREATRDVDDAVDQLAAELPEPALAALRRAVERLHGHLGAFAVEPPTKRDEPDVAAGLGVTAPPPLASDVSSEAPSPDLEGRARAKAGFTLVEVMLVVAVVGILAAMALPAYSTILEVARVTRAIGDIRGVDREVQAHRALNGCLPSSLTDMGYGHLMDPWGSPYVYQVLEIGPSGGGGGGGGGGGKGGKGGGGGGAAACAACNGGCVGKGQARKDHNLVPVNSDYDFFSVGKDRKSASAMTAGPSQDDIVRASDGGFIGLVRDY